MTGVMQMIDRRANNTPEHVADQAMGVELMAIEVEEQLEWAEAQGRDSDAAALKQQLTDLLDQLADIAETLPAAA
jgi:NTP pyrophosphatase (non-canonical NTP hydrolase)